MKSFTLFVFFLGCAISVFAQNPDEQLLRAALIGDIKEVENALANGAHIEAKTGLGWTALLRAANQGYTEIVRILLDKGANIEAKGSEGNALVYAVWNGHIRTAKLLLERKANIYTRSMIPTIIFAANNGHLEIVKMFLDAGIDVNTKDEIAGYGGDGSIRENTIITETALTEKEIESLQSVSKTTRSSDTMPKIEADKTIHLLPELQYFPTIGLPNHLGGATLLIWASQNGHTEIVRLLLDRGAKVNEPDTFDNFALYVATSGKHLDTVRLLLDRGADINQIGKMFDTTALICAVRVGSVDIVRLLIKHGAEVNIKESGGKTALKIAKEKNRTEIIKILEKAGAKE
jgi:ankyrin repeat protein